MKPTLKRPSMGVRTLNLLLAALALSAFAAIATNRGALSAREQRIQELERQLSERTEELNRLIISRNNERRASDSLQAEQSAPARQPQLSRNDIDPGHLVSMINLINGSDAARLLEIGQTQAIIYGKDEPTEDDPVLTAIDAIRQAGQLQEILLVGRTSQDVTRLKDTMASLIEMTGLPEKTIRITTDTSASRGSEGILIRLKARSKS